VSQAPNLRARTIHVSVREARMCVDRILLLAGLPSGYVSAVRDGVLISQGLGLGGLAGLLAVYPQLDMAAFAAMQVDEVQQDILHIDAAGLHAWLIAPTVVDLAVDIARRHGRGQVRIHAATAVAELRIIGELTKRHGASATVLEWNGDDAPADCTMVTVMNAPRPRSLERANPLLHDALAHGFPMNETLWRALHTASNAALAPDSVVSRRHAGPVILQDDGTLFGRVPADDDFDPKMLSTIPSSSAGGRP
jgi:hypothetical protein